MTLPESGVLGAHLGQVSVLAQAEFSGSVAISGAARAGDAVLEIPAETVSDCETLMQSYLAAAGDSDTYERDADLSATQNGDGCNTAIGEPKAQ